MLLEELPEALPEARPEKLPDKSTEKLPAMPPEWIPATRRMVVCCVLLMMAGAAPAAAGDDPEVRVPLTASALAMTALTEGDDPSYLAFEARFREADADERAAVERWVRERFDGAPTASNRLRLAIVGFLTDGTLTGLRRVRDELRFLVSLDDLMSEAEQHAARVYLAQVERDVNLKRRIIALERRGDGLVRDLGDAEGDIALLKGQVDMLRRQIEHLTDIERVIDEGNRQALPFDMGLATEREERSEAESSDADLPAEEAAERNAIEDDS